MNFNYSFCSLSLSGVTIFVLWGISPQKLGINIAQNSATDNTILVRQEELITNNLLINLEEKFKEAQRKTELLDDETEKILYRHKKWFFLFLLLFVIIAYKSLTMNNK